MAMIFDSAYQEEAALADGTRVRVRLLRPDDKERLREGWERLSPASRYRRFLSAKTRLTDAELVYLTEMDQVDHVAIGAESVEDNEPLGVARFQRTAGRTDAAEAAVVVIDGMQGRGLGRLLLSRLVRAAAERGIGYFTCEVLASNEPMLNLLKSLVPETNAIPNGESVILELRLHDADAGDPPVPSEKASPLYRLFAAVARGGIDLRQSFAELGALIRGR